MICCLLVIFVGCDKIKSTEEKMEGTWDVYSLKVTLSNGLSYYYDNVGTVTYSDFNKGEGNYVMNISYTTTSGTVTNQDSGVITLKDKGKYYDLKRDNGDGTYTALPEGRIILITNNDIKTAYQADDQTYLMILEK